MAAANLAAPELGQIRSLLWIETVLLGLGCDPDRIWCHLDQLDRFPTG